MFKGTVRALRFGKAWKVGPPLLLETELEIERSDGTTQATLLVPANASGPLPGWVTLHGITRPGRRHPTLVRFVRALASSGAAVLVPEIPEWKEMLLAPREAADTLRAAVLALAGREESIPHRLGVMGFSFGGPQALLAGLDPALAPHLKVVASFGGYCDLERTVRFLFSGEHEWRGKHFRAEPDPYGRWVVGGNYLTRAEGFEGTEAVAEALLGLARAAGDEQVASWDAHHDARKLALEQSLPPSEREIFRVFAPAKGEEVAGEAADELIPALTRAALKDSPLFDISSDLPRLKIPVRLIHGRQDRLIPFTESLRLAEQFPPGSDVRVLLTGLFSHSQRDGGRMRIGELAEQLRFLHLMSVVLGTV
jgi:dipeptidyl aminopeptidase/acylaminoacyl peptidase